MGFLLAQAGCVVVNGGYGGSMEASAQGAKRAGGSTVGVTTEAFGGKANPYIDEEIRVKTWLERVLKLMELGDAFIVLAGGTGTLVELAVSVEMRNKGLMAGKPILAVGRFWKEVLAALRKNPLMKLDSVTCVDSPEGAVALLARG